MNLIYIPSTVTGSAGATRGYAVPTADTCESARRVECWARAGTAVLGLLTAFAAFRSRSRR